MLTSHLNTKETLAVYKKTIILVTLILTFFVTPAKAAQQPDFIYEVYPGIVNVGSALDLTLCIVNQELYRDFLPCTRMSRNAKKSLPQ